MNYNRFVYINGVRYLTQNTQPVVKPTIDNPINQCIKCKSKELSESEHKTACISCGLHMRYISIENYKNLYDTTCPWCELDTQTYSDDQTGYIKRCLNCYTIFLSKKKIRKILGISISI